MDSSTASNRQIFLLRETTRGSRNRSVRDKSPVTSGWLRNNECGRRRAEKRSESLAWYWLLSRQQPGQCPVRWNTSVNTNGRPFVACPYVSLFRYPQKLAIERLLPTNPLATLSLSLSPFLCRFNLTRIGLPCTHPRNHSYGFTSVVDNRTRLPRNFCTARTCFSCCQTCPSISRKSSPWKLGATLWKLGSRGRLGKSTLLATIVRAKNLNGSRFSIEL